VRIPLFDYHYRPQPDGWATRWEIQGGSKVTVEDDYLSLHTRQDPEEYQWLVYRNVPLGGYKARPVTDEYSYNGKDGSQYPEPIHDFEVECDLEVLGGNGRIVLGITDGRDDLVVELPVGALQGGTRLSEAPPEGRRGSAADDRTRTYRTAPTFGLKPAETAHVELAFVDRRLTLMVNGSCPFAPVDRPGVEGRSEVMRPVRLGARGVDVHVRNFRLYRDIHYTDAGRHAVRAPVRLGAGEYFVLGDNSPNSDDNRFWSDAEGRPLPVPETNLLGKPFLVHLPSRLVRWDALGRHWECQGLDWSRVHWLR
jgi:signal peptidase I